jgi:hypothetical protein
LLEKITNAFFSSLACKTNLPSFRFLETYDASEQGGLSTSARTKDGDNFIPIEAKIQAAENAYFIE